MAQRWCSKDRVVPQEQVPLILLPKSYAGKRSAGSQVLYVMCIQPRKSFLQQPYWRYRYVSVCCKLAYIE